MYEKINYSSFFWKFGTTSFRTKEFNKMTEWQLRLLDEFWQKPENAGLGWEKAVPGQDGIYEIKNRYYDWLVENGFTKGNDKVKYKAAREKTSGLFDMGLIDNEHRLTEVGRRLLAETENFENNIYTVNQIGISLDSQLYLEQLLKLSDNNTGATVRPFIIVLYLLSELGHLTYDEFRYLMPLCISHETTLYILNAIRDLRQGKGSIDDILTAIMLQRPNYKEGLTRFVRNEFSRDLLLSVSMNRKSMLYDAPYITLYNELYRVFMLGDKERIYPLFQLINKSGASSALKKWKTILFDTVSSYAVNKDPESHLIRLPENVTETEETFKEFFFKTMHLFKAKATLEDYLDLNRRYLGLTNCFIFDEEQVKLDIVPRQFFNSAIEELYKEAYKESPLLFVNCSMEAICPALVFDRQKMIDGLNKELGTSLTTIEEAYDEVERIKYDRLNKLIDQKFTTDKLMVLLNDFDNRNDDNISKLVTDNADVPTIFEYVLGIIWYKASDRKGKVLDYLKLSLDANLLPVTHAAGGEADIVYEYPETKDYPAHSLLLEATLADGTNQRRMEMEPVSRHLGNHLLRTKNKNSYCVFATSYLHVNVIGDFRIRKSLLYCDTQNPNNYIVGMKIIPITTTDLRTIVEYGIKYPVLYKQFDIAYNAEEPHPQLWYDGYVDVAKNLLYGGRRPAINDVAAEPKES